MDRLDLGLDPGRGRELPRGDRQRGGHGALLLRPLRLPPRFSRTSSRGHIASQYLTTRSRPDIGGASNYSGRRVVRALRRGGAGGQVQPAAYLGAVERGGGAGLRGVRRARGGGPAERAGGGVCQLARQHRRRGGGRAARGVAALMRDYYQVPEETLVAGGLAATLSVTLDGATTLLPWQAGTRMLDVLIEAGLDAPYSCRQGICGACACLLTGGEVEMAHNEVLERPTSPTATSWSARPCR